MNDKKKIINVISMILILLGAYIIDISNHLVLPISLMVLGAIMLMVNYLHVE